MFKRFVLGAFMGLFCLQTGAVESTHPLGPERVAELTALLAKRIDLERDDLACRVMAASLAYRFLSDGNGRWHLEKDDFIKRVIGYHRETFAAVSAALDAKEMPGEHRELLRRDFARKSLWPVRYRYPASPVATWKALIDSIPADCRLLAVAEGQGLHEALGAEWPAWVGLPAIARKAVLDRLAEINPRLRSDGGFLAQASVAQTGHVSGNGTDPLDTGFFAPLAELVAETDLTPAAAQQWEYLPIPIGGGEVWVCRYRLVPSMLLVPPAAVLAAWADPPVLDLANLPLTDLAWLADMHPERLDLSGTEVTDLKPLASCPSLRELLLMACPVEDIGAVTGLKLELLDLRDTRVADLSPLAGMPLRHLDLRDAPVTDLTPLAGCPLTMLFLTSDGAYTGIEQVVKASGLERIGDVAVDTWRQENAWKREEGPFWDLASGGPVDDCDDDDDGGKTGSSPAKHSAPPARPTPLPLDVNGGEKDDIDDDVATDIDELLED